VEGTDRNLLLKVGGRSCYTYRSNDADVTDTETEGSGEGSPVQNFAPAGYLPSLAPS